MISSSIPEFDLLASQIRDDLQSASKVAMDLPHHTRTSSPPVERAWAGLSDLSPGSVTWSVVLEQLWGEIGGGLPSSPVWTLRAEHVGGGQGGVGSLISLLMRVVADVGNFKSGAEVWACFKLVNAIKTSLAVVRKEKDTEVVTVDDSDQELNQNDQPVTTTSAESSTTPPTSLTTQPPKSPPPFKRAAKASNSSVALQKPSSKTCNNKGDVEPNLNQPGSTRSPHKKVKIQGNPTPPLPTPTASATQIDAKPLTERTRGQQVAIAAAAQLAVGAIGHNAGKRLARAPDRFRSGKSGVERQLRYAKLPPPGTPSSGSIRLAPASNDSAEQDGWPAGALMRLDGVPFGWAPALVLPRTVGEADLYKAKVLGAELAKNTSNMLVLNPADGGVMEWVKPDRLRPLRPYPVDEDHPAELSELDGPPEAWEGEIVEGWQRVSSAEWRAAKLDELSAHAARDARRAVARKATERRKREEEELWQDIRRGGRLGSDSMDTSEDEMQEGQEEDDSE